MTAPDPQVTTAPAEGGSSGTASPAGPLRRRRLPPHIGPAHTSTVLLAVAFVAIGLLYLFVRPETPDPAGSSVAGRQGEQTTQAPGSPTPSPAPAQTSESSPAPTSEDASPETAAPDDGTTEAPTEPTEPTEDAGSTTPPDETVAPTTVPAPTTGAPAS